MALQWELVPLPYCSGTVVGVVARQCCCVSCCVCRALDGGRHSRRNVLALCALTPMTRAPPTSVPLSRGLLLEV